MCRASRLGRICPREVGLGQECLPVTPWSSPRLPFPLQMRPHRLGLPHQSAVHLPYRSAAHLPHLDPHCLPAQRHHPQSLSALMHKPPLGSIQLNAIVLQQEQAQSQPCLPLVRGLPLHRKLLRQLYSQMHQHNLTAHCSHRFVQLWIGKVLPHRISSRALQGQPL